METIMEIMRTDIFLLSMTGVMLILLIGFIVLLVKSCGLNKRYKEFMQKLGNGKNLQEDLETYMYRVEKVEKENAKNANDIAVMDHDMKKCIQKMGMVRYNAFRDVGSDLSFSLALLDENNDGVVLNGIYAREMSNIYAKPIKNGKSTYTVSDEEQQAIEQAMQMGDIKNKK